MNAITLDADVVVVGAGVVTLYTHTEGRVATRIGTYPADSVIDTLTM